MWLFGSTSVACPSCPTTDRVRSIVFGDGFWGTFGVGLLPFAVVIAVSVLAYRLHRPSLAEVANRGHDV